MGSSFAWEAAENPWSKAPYSMGETGKARVMVGEGFHRQPFDRAVQ
jgi:hypothetical protein